MTESAHTSSSRSARRHDSLVNVQDKGILRFFPLFCLLSILLHLCVLAGGIWISPMQPSVSFIDGVVPVDLVSFDPGPDSDKGDSFQTLPPEPVLPPPPHQEPESEEPEVIEPESPEPKEPEPEVVPTEPAQKQETVIRPDISLKTKPKNIDQLLAKEEKPEPVKEKEIIKKPVKKLQEKPDPQKVLSQARKRLAEKLKIQEQDNQKQIAQALERMNQKVQKGQNPGGTGGTGTRGGKKSNDAMDLYKMILSSAIRQNWIFNEAMTRVNQGLEVRLRIKILQNGEIRDIIYESRSGNAYLDDSAKKAIQRSNPLPSLPNAMKSYEVGVIFTPKGLQ